MVKPYELHEQVYRSMHADGVKSWMQRHHPEEVDADHLAFLEDVRSQPFIPRHGSVLEIGCGSAPLLRWFEKQGHVGMGIDVSRTAVSMAKEQSSGLPLTFRVADICTLDPTKFPQFDICVDGQCFHCIIRESDRRSMLVNVRSIMKHGGIFILLTMCSPIDKDGFRALYPAQKVTGNKIYVPFQGCDEIEGALKLGEKNYFPTRSVPHWTNILKELRQAGFMVQMMRLRRCSREEVCSSLLVCATAAHPAT